MNKQLEPLEFMQRYDVRSFLAASYSGCGLDSAIVNIRAPYDRRRNQKTYIYFDYKQQAYTFEKM